MTAVVEELSRRLADGEVIVIDSAMGTELRARGVPMDDEAWSVVANLSHGHVVQAIHEDHVRAGRMSSSPTPTRPSGCRWRAGVQRHRRSPCGPRAEAPTLLLAGRQDESFARDARRLFRAMSSTGKALVMTAGSEHGIDLLQDTKAERALLEFLVGG